MIPADAFRSATGRRAHDLHGAAVSGDQVAVPDRVAVDVGGLVRVQPDLPRYFIYNERTGKTGDDQRDEAYQAAWERAGGLDEGLLRAIANVAKIPGGAVVFLDHDDQDFPGSGNRTARLRHAGT